MNILKTNCECPDCGHEQHVFAGSRCPICGGAMEPCALTKTCGETKIWFIYFTPPRSDFSAMRADFSIN